MAMAGEDGRERVKEKVRRLVRQLKDEDPWVAAAAAEALFDLGIKVICPLRSLVLPFSLLVLLLWSS